MRTGIIGLDQSGKTTLFNALTETSDESQGKREAHLSIVKVPDARLDRLHQLFPTAKKTQATSEFLDVGGLAKGSSQRKGFQEKFFADVRSVDSLVCVLRYFEDEAVPHPEETIDPARDWRIIEEEFLLSDLAILEGRIERVRSELQKTKKPELQKELDLLEKCYATLEEETPLRGIKFTDEENKRLRGFQFLTAKPVLLVLNIGENDLPRIAQLTQEFSSLADGNDKRLLCLSSKLEMEIAALSDEDKEEFQTEMGIEEPALNKMIRTSYDLLGLISFFTAGEKEVRAWTIKKETRAQEAAGAIHSDMERGFIRAEVVHFETLSQLETFAKCKDRGELRLEGKEYMVQDGDVITFRFNV